MRLFRLYRQTDVTGTTGPGLVAEAIEFSSGRVAISFFPGQAGVSSVTVFETLDDAIRIHGHEGATSFIPVSVAEYSEGRLPEWMAA